MLEAQFAPQALHGVAAECCCLLGGAGCLKVKREVGGQGKRDWMVGREHLLGPLVSLIGCLCRLGVPSLPGKVVAHAAGTAQAV